jgi:ABC-2 type transport system ATP-binding protein
MGVIKVAGLKKHYPIIKGYRELLFHPLRKKRTTALDGIDLELEQGRCFCLLGPNGAGKTSLIKILATLVLPDEGSAFVNGFNVQTEPDKVKASIGYAIGEERSFYWRLTGRQNLEFFASLNNLSAGEFKSKIDWVLSLTNLREAADQRFNTYSTGMRQMMSFARALLNDSKVLFVDEPTRSLDPQAARKIRKFLREDLCEREGRTVFWATHNLAEAEEYGHELAVIDRGRIKIKGTVRELTGAGEISLADIYEKSVGESRPGFAGREAAKR